MKLLKEKILPVIMSALNEDIGSGDMTTALVFEKDMDARAEIIAGEDCVIAGVDVVRWVFDSLDEKIGFTALYKDGAKVKKGKKVICLKGSIRGILAGERTALNFLSRLSGIATLTSRFVEKIKGADARIMDTRKTTPGLRVLEKYAVAVGGGYNHRAGLWDGMLIKDNHINSSKLIAHSSKENVIKELIKKARGKGYKTIEIEVNNLKEFQAALEAGADIIMLDNMRLEEIKRAVKLKAAGDPSAWFDCAHHKPLGTGKRQATRTLLEVSGGVNIGNVRNIAKTGVDRISIGSLTHSTPSVDFSLELCK